MIELIYMERIRALLHRSERISREIESCCQGEPEERDVLVMARIKSSASSLSIYIKATQDEECREKLLYKLAVALGALTEIEGLMMNRPDKGYWGESFLPHSIDQMKTGIKGLVRELLSHNE